MITRDYLLAGLAAAVFSASVFAEAWVEERSGKKIRGAGLEQQTADGTLLLDLGGAKRTFPKGTYNRAYVDMPGAVKKLQDVFNGGDFALVQKVAPKILDEYGYVGWGDLVCYFLGMVDVERGNFKAALSRFEQGKQYRGANGMTLAQGYALALAGLKQNEPALQLLGNIVSRGNDEAAGFAFNLRGKIYASQGKKHEAVLEYLKTLIVLKSEAADRDRKEAKSQVVALLKEMGDPRYKEFEKFD